ncbi:MAG: hypothetical protein IJV44_10460 [Prevotella sp.]|nr:hypothetical protein [Prevotella sp.]
MSKYIDRIIEVLDDNNVWQTVMLPTDGMGDKEESVVFGYAHDSNYDVNMAGTLVRSATEISVEKVAETTRAYIKGHNHQYQIYAVSLTAMKLQVELCIERYYSQLADCFHGRNYHTVMKAFLDTKQQGGQCLEDNVYDNPHEVYNDIMEDVQDMVGEMSKIETLARYISGVTDPDRIRMIFFQN